eukprot:5288845-Ditylum_brightwellii.AAC.1
MVVAPPIVCSRHDHFHLDLCHGVYHLESMPVSANKRALPQEFPDNVNDVSRMVEILPETDQHLLLLV